MPNISVAVDFTNAAVAAGQNPSNAGYHHGEHILTIVTAPFWTVTVDMALDALRTHTGTQTRH
jgi:hypothetical protein